MTAPDLTTIVESVARDHHERWSERVLAEAPNASIPSWDDRDGTSKHSVREAVLPAVQATLNALEPLVTQWALEAWKHAHLGDLAGERGDWTLKHIEHGRRDALSDVVNNLRALVPTSGEKP